MKTVAAIDVHFPIRVFRISQCFPASSGGPLRSTDNASELVSVDLFVGFFYSFCPSIYYLYSINMEILDVGIAAVSRVIRLVPVVAEHNGAPEECVVCV